MRPLTVVALALFAVSACLPGSETVSTVAGLAPISEQDEQRVAAALDAVIRAGEQRIADLEREIEALEASNRAKSAEIDALVESIAARRAELEERYRQNLVLCVFFPDPSVCVLANVIANDSRMREYETQLARARTEQARVHADIDRYARRRDALRRELEPLRASRQRLVEALRMQVAPDVPAVLNDPATAAAFERAQVAGAVADAFDDEIAVLLEIRAAALELQASLDQALIVLGEVQEAVDRLVSEARDSFMELLEALLSDDPDAAARDWLDQQLADRTSQVLRALDWPARRFAEHLVRTRGAGEPDPAALLRDLLEALGSSGEPWTGQSTGPVVIEGTQPGQWATQALSTIVAPADLVPTQVEVTVEIDASDPVPLRVFLRHAGQRHLVADFGEVPRDGAPLHRAFDLGPAVGAPEQSWTLAVHNFLGTESALLRRWTITLR